MVHIYGSRWMVIVVFLTKVFFTSTSLCGNEPSLLLTMTCSLWKNIARLPSIPTLHSHEASQIQHQSTTATPLAPYVSHWISFPYRVRANQQLDHVFFFFFFHDIKMECVRVQCASCAVHSTGFSRILQGWVSQSLQLCSGVCWHVSTLGWIKHAGPSLCIL